MELDFKNEGKALIKEPVGEEFDDFYESAMPEIDSDQSIYNHFKHHYNTKTQTLFIDGNNNAGRMDVTINILYYIILYYYIKCFNYYYYIVFDSSK